MLKEHYQKGGVIFRPTPKIHRVNKDGLRRRKKSHLHVAGMLMRDALSIHLEHCGHYTDDTFASDRGVLYSLGAVKDRNALEEWVQDVHHVALIMNTLAMEFDSTIASLERWQSDQNLSAGLGASFTFYAHTGFGGFSISVGAEWRHHCRRERLDAMCQTTELIHRNAIANMDELETAITNRENMEWVRETEYFIKAHLGTAPVRARQRLRYAQGSTPTGNSSSTPSV